MNIKINCELLLYNKQRIVTTILLYGTKNSNLCVCNNELERNE